MSNSVGQTTLGLSDFADSLRINFRTYWALNGVLGNVYRYGSPCRPWSRSQRPFASRRALISSPGSFPIRRRDVQAPTRNEHLRYLQREEATGPRWFHAIIAIRGRSGQYFEFDDRCVIAVFRVVGGVRNCREAWDVSSDRV
jgi:hypothetical protein